MINVYSFTNPETGANIMTIAQQIEAKGEARGEIRGIEKGKFEAKKEIAQKLLKQGLSLEAISQITELSMQEI